MKKILLYIGIALAAIGCTKDVDVDSQSGDTALTITSNITTRADKSAWADKDAIGVYVTQATDVSNVDNVKFTTDGSGIFTSATSIYLPLSSAVTLFAYYPYSDADGFDYTKYPINSAEQVDLLSAKEESVSGSSSTVDMTFYHRLSKISLTIVEGDGLTTGDLTNLVVKLSNISTTATFDLTGNATTPTNTADELTLTTPDTGTLSSAIIIPQTLSGATLYFTTEDYGTFDAALTTEEFITGKEYKYKVTINRDGVDVSEANIDAWDENEDTGTADIVDIEYKSDGKYHINSAKGLTAFRDLVNGNITSNSTGATFFGFDEALFKDTSGNTSIHGVLTRDVDISEYTNWEPIGFWSTGNIKNYYMGTFDGGGHKISGLTISNAANQRGLFRYIGTNGVVRNLGVSGSVTCTDYDISNSYEVGGITAWNEGYIYNCYSEIDVTGEFVTNAGGIAAYNVGYVVNCYNGGDVKGETNVGGIVGYNYAGGYVGYSLSTGVISGGVRLGGVVGYNIETTDESPTIKGCFCLKTDTNPYSIGQLSTNASSGGLTTNACDEEYLTSDGFATIMNNGVWTYNSTSPAYQICGWDYNEDGYPSLNFDKVITEDDYKWIYDIIYNSGTYDIYTALGLKAFAAMVNGEAEPTGLDGKELVTSGGDHFEFSNAQSGIDGQILTLNGADIDLTGWSWSPIGTSDQVTYNGTFNGNGRLVSNLSVTSVDYAGLFGYTNSDADISNLGVSGSVSGNKVMGGVAGCNNGYITNCYNVCTVSVGSYVDVNAGGITGYNNGSVVNCYNTGQIDHAAKGGVVGYNETGYITNCYDAYGNGNVIGSDLHSRASNCYYLVSEATEDPDAMLATDMQSENFATLLNDNAYAYNASYPSATQACGWIAGGYPSLNIGVDPSMTYWTLSRFTSSNYPTTDTTWYISDSEASSADLFDGLEGALETAYNEGKNITIIFSNLESLVTSAFNDCTYLTSISLPSATEIGSSAFERCSNLSSISLPNATKIGSSAFYYCSNLTSISLPSATEIGTSAFYYCSGLTSISLPSATEIGTSAFSICSNLTSISLPSATKIGAGAFYICSSLATLDLGSSGSGITSIGADAFMGASVTTCDLTIKIASEATDVSVENETTLRYNNSSTTTFKSITVVDND